MADFLRGYQELPVAMRHPRGARPAMKYCRLSVEFSPLRKRGCYSSTSDPIELSWKQHLSPVAKK
jgi:hypothetical protein